MHLPEYAKSETLLFLVFPLSTFILDDSYDSRLRNGVSSLRSLLERVCPELTRVNASYGTYTSNKRFTVFAILIFV